MNKNRIPDYFNPERNGFSLRPLFSQGSYCGLGLDAGQDLFAEGKTVGAFQKIVVFKRLAS